MNLRKANIFINRFNQLGFVGQEPTSVNYGFVDAMFNVLRKFDRIIFGYPTTQAEQDIWHQILSARFRELPTAKFYGYTSKQASDIIAVWATQEIQWHTLYGGLLNGIFIADFDATDVLSTADSKGTFTRTDQNLAVTGCHNDGYEVFAESYYPELTLGGAAIGEADPLIGRSDTLQDTVMLKNYMTDVDSGLTNEARSKGAREGSAAFLRDMAARPEINLYTAVSYHSPNPDPISNGTPTYVALDKWLTLTSEVNAYIINGFGVDTAQESPTTDTRWFSTNNMRSDSWSVLSDDPDVSYCRLVGRVFWTEPNDIPSSFTLRYRRTADQIGSNPYFDKSGEVAVTPALDGTWEVLLGAAASSGTVYKITLDDADTCQTFRKTITLIGGQTVEY